MVSCEPLFATVIERTIVVFFCVPSLPLLWCLDREFRWSRVGTITHQSGQCWRATRSVPGSSSKQELVMPTVYPWQAGPGVLWSAPGRRGPPQQHLPTTCPGGEAQTSQHFTLRFFSVSWSNSLQRWGHNPPHRLQVLSLHQNPVLQSKGLRGSFRTEVRKTGLNCPPVGRARKITMCCWWSSIQQEKKIYFANITHYDWDICT